jgi:acyl-CoA synthetase (AMP-forming)/AMP-acid ligase II
MIQTFERDYKVNVLHAWGMTELSPLGTLCTMKFKHRHLCPRAADGLQAKQGRGIFGIDMKIVDARG